jgi:hypothetical protein
MKLVTAVRLLPRDPADEAANMASVIAYGQRARGRQELQRRTYGDLKAMGLSAQPAIQVARKVAGAYATLRANLRAGNYGPEGSRRRVAAAGKPVTFRSDAAQPYDDRSLSWQSAQRTISIWTVAGRIRVPFACSPAQFTMLERYRHGESDLVCRDDRWFLHATCEVPEEPLFDPDGFLGVDLGIANIATTDDGTRYSGKRLNRVRQRNQRLRATLQAKGTKSAKRLLKKRSRKEPDSPPTPTIASPSRSWPRLNAPDAGLPWRTSRASADGYGSASPSGSHCTRGHSPSSAGSPPIRRGGPESRSYS